MSEVNISQTSIILLAGVISWIIDDCIANAILKKYNTGTMLRFIGARWLSRKKAVKYAIVQFIIAFLLTFPIEAFFNYVYSLANFYLIPIFLTTVGILYPYILAGLPYRIKAKHLIPSILLIILGILFFSGIYYFTHHQSFNW